MEPTEAQYLIINALETLDSHLAARSRGRAGCPSHKELVSCGVGVPPVQSISARYELELLQWRIYDEGTGYWYIETPSPILPLAMILPNGDIVPVTWGL